VWEMGLGSYGGVAVPATVFNLRHTSSIVAKTVSSTRVAVVFVDNSDGRKGKLWLCSNTGQQVLSAVTFYSGPIAHMAMHTSGSDSIAISFEGSVWLGKWATGRQTWISNFSSPAKQSSIVATDLNRTVVAFTDSVTSQGNVWIGDTRTGVQALNTFPDGGVRLAEGSPAFGMALNAGLAGDSVQVAFSEVIPVPSMINIKPMSFYYLQQSGMLTTSKLDSALSSPVESATLVGMGLPGNQLRTMLEPVWVRLAFSTNPEQCTSATPLPVMNWVTKPMSGCTLDPGMLAFSSTPKWYRFNGVGHLQNQLPITSASANSSFTCYGSAWLSQSSTPAVYETGTAEVCFRFGSVPCWVSTEVRVTNCGGFFVHELKAVDPVVACPVGSVNVQSPNTVSLSCWFLGSPGESCSTACAKKGATCSALESMESDYITSIGTKLGYLDSSISATSSTVAPFLSSSNVYYNSNYANSGFSCSASSSSYSRFCPCMVPEAAAPVKVPECAGGVLDGELNCWRLASAQQSCNTACASTSATCNPTTQSSIGGYRTLMNFLGKSCSYGWSSSTQSYAPYWSPYSGNDGYCYYPSSSTELDCSTTLTSTRRRTAGAGMRICPCTK